MIGTSAIELGVALLGVVGLLAASSVVIRSSATKASAVAWKGEAEAQKARADRLEADLADLKARVQALEREKQTLVDLATSSSAIERLTELVVHQHGETLAAITA